ncbi:hypothetical protein HA466_0067700 [Hirschfeldia incana]|nr:hypothetical protein HA466_0067700 [Hirschfeldia incana]
MLLRKRGSQRYSGESIFHLDGTPILFGIMDFGGLPYILCNSFCKFFSPLQVPEKNNDPDDGLAKWSTTMTTDQTIKEEIILVVVSSFTGEVVDAYYLEMDNDDDEVTEDDDEDAKGGG